MFLQALSVWIPNFLGFVGRYCFKYDLHFVEHNCSSTESQLSNGTDLDLSIKRFNTGRILKSRSWFGSPLGLISVLPLKCIIDLIFTSLLIDIVSWISVFLTVGAQYRRLFGIWITDIRMHVPQNFCKSNLSM